MGGFDATMQTMTDKRKKKPVEKHRGQQKNRPARDVRDVTPVPDSPFALEVRASEVHGKGVFAAERIAKDSEIIAYTGEIISWEEADARHPHNPAEPNHTFYFSLEDETVIDGAAGGNDARWINHSCEPNCQAFESDDGVFISSMRTIRSGEELTFDYALVIDETITDELKEEYACRCGSIQCRGTMLAVPEHYDGENGDSGGDSASAVSVTEKKLRGEKKRKHSNRKNKERKARKAKS